MEERILKYCSKCAYELRESVSVNHNIFFTDYCVCPQCQHPRCTSTMYVDENNLPDDMDNYDKYDPSVTLGGTDDNHK
jgi:hypothetical protein